MVAGQRGDLEVAGVFGIDPGDFGDFRGGRDGAFDVDEINRRFDEVLRLIDGGRGKVSAESRS